jgi:hypothetical protein
MFLTTALLFSSLENCCIDRNTYKAEWEITIKKKEKLNTKLHFTELFSVTLLYDLVCGKKINYLSYQ